MKEGDEQERVLTIQVKGEGENDGTLPHGYRESCKKTNAKTTTETHTKTEDTFSYKKTVYVYAMYMCCAFPRFLVKDMLPAIR